MTPAEERLSDIKWWCSSLSIRVSEEEGGGKMLIPTAVDKGRPSCTVEGSSSEAPLSGRGGGGGGVDVERLSSILQQV